MQLVETWHNDFGLNRCLRVVGLAKSSWYYHKRKSATDKSGLSAQNRRLKALLVEIIGKHPSYGWRKLTAEVNARINRRVNHKRVRRLLKLADLQLRRNVSKASVGPVSKVLASHTGELNRLAGRTFGRFELLSGDFTQLPYSGGNRKAWLAAFYDPVGCLPCGWAVGRSANTPLTLDAWQKVQATYRRWNRSLEVATLHTDQDSVFKSYRWLGQVLCDDQLEVSYSERGAKDNPWIESLWSRLKDEAGQLLFDCKNLSNLNEQINWYFENYIHNRRHESLDNHKPIELLNHQQTNGEHDPLQNRQLVL